MGQEVKKNKKKINTYDFSFRDIVRRRQEQSSRRLQEQLDRIWEQAHQNRLEREKKEAEWEKTKRLLSLFDKK
jgi:hypothetical protein